jgi:Kef-type K+ transport system membrane component KefB
MSIFLEISLILLITTAVSFVMKFLRQPLVVGYILAGILVGPSVFNLLAAHDTVELFSKLGITILLFIVGLHLNPKVIKEVGSVSLITGLGQVIFTSFIGFMIAIALGLDRVAALYIAIALTFSSTIIILKLLSDKSAVQTLYGKIAIGFLLVQDIVATIILLVVSAIGGSEGVPLSLSLLYTLGKGTGVLAGIYLVTQYILPRITAYAGRNPELLFLFALTWGLGFAALFYVLGLSIEIGALIGGVTLSVTPFAEEMSARLRPLRDFFIILFFILLGSSMILTASSQILVPVIIFSFFVLIGNPVIVIILMNLLGYHKRTGFMAGLTVAQISEFSLILATLGFQIGHLSQEVLTIITMVGLITIAGSTYLILYSDTIYPVVEKFLKYLELRTPTHSQTSQRQRIDVLLFGYHRAGQDFSALFDKLGYRVGVVDIDPEVEDRLMGRNQHFFYGDAGNPEFLQELPTAKVKIVVSTIPDHEINILLIKFFRYTKPELTFLSFAQTKEDMIELYEAGADYVVLPEHIGARHLVKVIEAAGIDSSAYNRRKQAHLRELALRVA